MTAELILTALDGSGLERRIVAGKPFTLGRGPDNDWVLPDPQREVSKQHCRIEAEGQDFILTDSSINGVSVEGEGGPTGPGRRHRLAPGQVFGIGPYRFAVSRPDRTPETAATDQIVPADVADILRGATEGVEPRAAGAVSGPAASWLGTLPIGSAEEAIRQPFGWDEPPRPDAAPAPADVGEDATEFGNRSHHGSPLQDALHLPGAIGAIPADWLDEGDQVAAASPLVSSAAPVGAPAPSASELRGVLLDAARLDAPALAHVPDALLMRRVGAALRACLDGLNTLEAAQAVAEHACELPNQAAPGLWADFFAGTRDPALALLVDDNSGPAEAVGDRVSALADRQRRLGRAVAEAAEACDPLAPDAVAAESAGLPLGPFRSAAAWKLYADRHAALMPDHGKGFAFLLLLRTRVARLLAGQSS